MTGNNRLTPRQYKAIAALITSKSIQEAASIVGVSERTLRRWLELSEFQLALHEGESELIDLATRRLTKLSDQAISYLETFFTQGGRISAFTRLKAVSTILTMLIRLHELRNLEFRLTELEKKIDNLDQKQKII